MSSAREVVLDTETTGLSVFSGHRIIEIGCVEIIDNKITGKEFHCYINPKRSVSEEAYKVHGLSDEFLRDKPVFAEIKNDFLNFIRGSLLVIHNAPFDLMFLNNELLLVGDIAIDEGRVTDTLLLARKRFPGSPASLDALCKRFKINLIHKRSKHTAILDAQLLALVHLNFKRLKQSQAGFESLNNPTHNVDNNHYSSANPLFARNFPIPSAEEEAHDELINNMINPLWKLYK